MKKRITFIGAILSLIPLGQPLLIKTGLFLSTAGLMFSVPEQVLSETTFSILQRGLKKLENDDYYGAISLCSRVIDDKKLNPDRELRGLAFFCLASAKMSLDDNKGACSDMRTSYSIYAHDLTLKRIRDFC